MRAAFWRWPIRLRELREDALVEARRFVALGIKPGDRIALVAETGPEFAACFFGAVYAGAWPVPLPLPTSFGGREAYVEQLGVQLKSCDPALFLFTRTSSPISARARRTARARRSRTWESLAEVDPPRASCPRPPADDIAYLQYSSGSTRFPHGVAVTHRALLDNLRGAQRRAPDDADRPRASAGCRGITTWGWSAACCRRSPTRFRSITSRPRISRAGPLAWLDLISRNPGISISYSPTFGYDICSRRMSSQTRAEDRFDLSRWRIAGNGADMIRPDVMQAFVDAFAAAGFKASAFCPSYGLAEATLAVSLMPPGEGIRLELVEENELSGGAPGDDAPAAPLSRHRQLRQAGATAWKSRSATTTASSLPDRGIGKVYVRGAR